MTDVFDEERMVLPRQSVPLVSKLDLSLIYLRGVQLFVQFLHALSADARALTAHCKGFLR